MATSDVAAETSERKIRYAVVGLGYISQIAIVRLVMQPNIPH